MTFNDFLLAAVIALAFWLGFVLMHPPRCVQERVIETRYAPIPRVENI